ncbi:MAG: thiamine pyrophosphate-binding protein, partial [Candidatus Methylomirabilis sp.]|nr:thiamine pyrophosphate-binding protein [Deltaproteobacteria bacterium]
MKAMSGGETIARMLAAEGVEKVFGIIDGTYFGFYSNLRKYGIDLITPRHETSAVHMAGAYAKLTGKLGVCMASNGPGAANALPGVAVENGEGSRVLLITSSRRTGIAYPDRGGTYQYFDQVAVMKPMTKWSGSAQAPARVPELMRRALRKCGQGRPGVVHLDVPENLMNAKDMAPEFLEPHEYRRVAEIVPPEDQVERAADILVGCRRPLIHAGSGVIHAQAFAELEKVAEILRAPVTTSWAARGALPETSDLSVPMVYVDLYTEVRNEADAVLVLGSRLGETDLWGKPPYWRKAAEQRTIQVDVDDDCLGCNKRTELAILSDARAFLDRLYGRLVEKKARIAAEERGAYLTSLKEKRLRKRRELDEALKDAASP